MDSDSDGSSSSTSCTITLPKHPYATSFTTPSVLITSAPDPPKFKQPYKSKPVRIKHYSSYTLSRHRRPPFTIRLGRLVCVTLDASCKMGEWKQYQGTFEDLTVDPKRGKYATSTVRYASKSKWGVAQVLDIRDTGPQGADEMEVRWLMQRWEASKLWPSSSSALDPEPSGSDHEVRTRGGRGAKRRAEMPGAR